MFFDSYDTPVFRPPSEARSFILRVTRGCAHNKCTYCNMYRGVPFQVLTEDEVARQIEAAAVHGMETGDDITLQAVKKGVSGEEAVEAGRKVIAAGMKLSMMIILGLAGKPGSKRHAAETAKAINAIKPTMLSALCLMLYRGSELLDQFERGEFEPLPPQGLMEELYSILAAVELPEDHPCIFRSNHVSNYVQLAGTLPKDKERLLGEIAWSASELGKIKDWDVYNNTRY